MSNNRTEWSVNSPGNEKRIMNWAAWHIIAVGFFLCFAGAISAQPVQVLVDVAVEEVAEDEAQPQNPNEQIFGPEH